MNLNQRLFSKQQQVALIEQWLTCDEYGMSTQKFCEQLVEYGDSQSKEIGEAGLLALNGGSVTSALKGWLPEVVVNSIEVAEEAGHRKMGLEGALRQLEGGQNVIRRLAGIMTIPFFVTLLISLLGVFVSGEILKAISGLSRQSVGGIGQDFHDAVALWGPWITLVILGVLSGVSVSFTLWHSPSRNITNNWPLYQQYRLATVAALLGSLGNLSQCGMKLDDALAAISNASSSRYLKNHIKTMRIRIEEDGEKNLGKILDTGLLLTFEHANLEVLGDTGDYAKLLLKSAKNHDKAVKKQLDMMSVFLPNMALVMAVLLLVTLVGASMVQLFEMINNLR